MEIERAYLLKNIPRDLDKSKSVVIEIGDFFDSNTVDALKVRRKGDSYELIKKEGESLAKRVEHVIPIKKEEFDSLIKATVQNHKKTRYFYKIRGGICEIDFYQGKLLGYARVEVEFNSRKAMENFNPPEWFGQEITAINHEIHEHLGIVTFDGMKKRYAKKGIELKPIYLK